MTERVSPQGDLFITPITYQLPVYTVQLIRDSSCASPTQKVSQSRDAAVVIRRYLEGVDREHFVVLLLNMKNQILGINTVAVGSINAAIVAPREVFKPAILAGAAAIIVGHNHPSGQALPSQEDRTLTRRLVAAGHLLGIPVLDHLIVGDGTDEMFSFADAGCLEDAG